jgi:hypothetical protein
VRDVRATLAIAIAGLLIGSIATAFAAPTRDEYRQQVNAICLQSNKFLKQRDKAESAAIDAQRWQKAARLERYFDRQFAHLIQKIAAVPPPAGDEALIASWLKAQRHQLSALRDFARALHSEDVRRIHATHQRALNADLESQAVIAGYGLGPCEKG